VVKNKVAPPFRVAEFDIIFSGPKIGISREGDIVDLGAEAEILKKQGAYYSFGETRLGQGREQAKEFLRDNPDVAKEIEALICEHHNAPVRTAPASTPDPAEAVAALAADEEEAE
jgi:recombination protein RecA